MRVSAAVAAALILAMSGPVFTQEYVEFVSRQDRFGVTFPVQPKVTETTFTSQFGSVLPARLYGAETSSGRFSVTVVDYNNIEAIATEKAKACPAGAETCLGGRGAGSSTGAGYWKADVAGAIINATWQFLQRPDAKVTYLGWNNIDLVEGHVMSFTNNDKSHTWIGIYMHENKLYILEGTVPAGRPGPEFFNQSVRFLDEDGNSIRYQTLYHNGFPKPSIGRQAQPGQGQGGRGAGAGRGGRGQQN
jgi:hypothetical protein